MTYNGMCFGYWYGAVPLLDDKVVQLECMGVYDLAENRCDGAVKGEIKTCNFNDDDECSRLLYSADFGTGKGTFEGGIFTGNITYKLIFNTYRQMKVTCKGDYNGTVCDGEAELEVDFDGMKGRGICKEGVYGEYCKGGLSLHYGNERVDTEHSDSEDGYFITCDGLYGFEKGFCKDMYKEYTCLGDYISYHKETSCIGITEYMECNEYYGERCGKIKKICTLYFSDDKCLKVEPADISECKGYVTKDSPGQNICHGQYVYPNSNGVSCNGAYFMAQNICEGNLQAPDSSCSGQGILNSACKGTFTVGKGILTYVCIGETDISSSMCNGVQKAYIKDSSNEICVGTSSLGGPSKCKGKSVTINRMTNISPDVFKGLYTMKSDNGESYSCEGFARLIGDGTKLFCVNKFEYSPPSGSDLKSFSCQIWDEEKCIPRNEDAEKRISHFDSE